MKVQITTIAIAAGALVTLTAAPSLAGGGSTTWPCKASGYTQQKASGTLYWADTVTREDSGCDKVGAQSYYFDRNGNARSTSIVWSSSFAVAKGWVNYYGRVNYGVHMAVKGGNTGVFETVK